MSRLSVQTAWKSGEVEGAVLYAQPPVTGTKLGEGARSM
jgi:hypothetical protein